MRDSTDDSRFYLFIHQLPPRPLYLRAKVRKLLSQAGALALKDSVYVLPLRPDRLPLLQRIAEVAAAGGGEAYVWQGDFVERPGHEELILAFQRARDEEYKALVGRVREWTDEPKRRSGPSPPEGRLRFRLAHAKRRLEQIAGNDFFRAPGRAQAEDAIENLEARLQPRPKTAPPREPNPELMGRTWVTRSGIQVDRIASAWLVRRFIDPNARFRFIDLHEEGARPGELTFDMRSADFTHEEDRCTFETLIRRTRLRDRALAPVAEIIHDIDIKDGKFGRPEAKGIEQLLLGMLGANPGDEERLDRGFALLDDLYQSFARQSRTASFPRGKGGGKPGTSKGGPA